MDDFGVWWYIIAGIIYLLSRRMKKKMPASRSGTENDPPSESKPVTKPVTFENLLREITGESAPGEESTSEEHPAIEIIEEPGSESEKERKTGVRAFTDEESRKIYDDSIKQAKDTNEEPKSVISEGKTGLFEEEEYTFASEIKDGLSSDEARKAIIYSNILNRKY